MSFANKAGPSPVVELQGLSKTFRTGVFHQRRVQAVRSVDLGVRRGEIFGFVGPNGAGKTTVIKMLMGLLRPTRGEATVFGERLPSRAVQARIGFLPETPHFYEYLTGVELLDFYGKLLGIPASRRAQRIPELVERVGMSGRVDRPLRKYSKGMVQRIGLAQALIHEPEFLVLDEPMSGLDPVGRREVREIIRQERDRGCTVFFSSHILADVEQLCDRVGFLVDGVLQFQGDLDELRRDRVVAIELLCTGLDPEALPEPIGKPALRVRSHAGTLSVVLPPDTDAIEVVEAVSAAGGKVLELRRQEPSLEDVFMEEVER